MSKIDPELSLRLTADIAVAYLTRNALERAEVPALLREIRDALEAGDPRKAFAGSDLTPRDVEAGSASPTAPEPEDLRVDGRGSPRPAVPIEASVTDDYLVSLEDGKHYRSLRRHLMAKYGMTPDDYRRKWGLPKDYPMVAPSYARQRSDTAKRIGLGQPVKKPGRRTQRNA